MAQEAESAAAIRDKGGANSTAASNSSPLIPLSLVDAPTQRVYIASAFLAIQAYKVYRLTSSLLVTEDTSPLSAFLLLDFVFVVIVSRLRTPRLDYKRARWAVFFALLGFVDWLLTGGWRAMLAVISSAPILGWIADGMVNTWTDTFNRQLSISEHRVRLRDIIQPSHHILGQHTIHVLPYSTASFSPSRSTSSIPSCFCLDADDPKAELSIPIVFNNTEPQFLSYSVSPLDSIEEGDKQLFNVTIAKSSLVRLSNGAHSREGAGREDQLDLELEDADDSDAKTSSSALVRHGEAGELKKLGTAGKRARSAGVREVMFHLPVRNVGRIRLERVLDRNRFDARLSSSEILVVACPKMGFSSPPARTPAQSALHFCPGDVASMDVWVNGLPPLELSYIRQQDDGRGSRVNEAFSISQIAASNLQSPLTAEGERSDQLAVALRGSRRQATHRQTFEWAKARNVSLPITLDTDKESRRVYRLDSVRDACGNKFDAGERSTRFYREAHVHRRPTVVFEGVVAGRPIDLLQNGPVREVAIRIEGEAHDEGPYTAQVLYEGVGESWTRNVTMARRTSITVDKPGTYSLSSVQGRYCDGEAGRSWMFAAREVAPPTASIEFNPIQDPCAGPVGVKALAVLSGSPPFRVKYRVERQGRPTQEHEQTIKRTREEIEFRPSTEGQVTYVFTGLSDANYKNIALDGPSFTQVLHPIASATFAGGANPSSGPTVTLHSCSGNTAKAQVDLEGVGPFEISYAIRSSGGELLETRSVKDVKTSSFPLELDVPAQIADAGGRVSVTLTSVKDAKGCERQVSAPDLTIDVRRTKSSVSFVEPRETTMLEGAKVALPVRLAGDAPWTVHYRKKGSEEVREATLTETDSSLSVDEPGTYVLIDVRDRHCSGNVQSARDSHVVTVRPRPTAAFEAQGQAVDSKSGALTRAAVCVGQPDAALLNVQGRFPVFVSYRHTPPSGALGDATVHRFNAAQNRTSIDLVTSTDGVHTYDLMQIGDAVYPPAVLPPASKKRRLEHTVHPLPFASFADGGTSSQQKHISLCLGEALRSEGTGGKVPPVALTGTPPFTLEYAIKDSMGTMRKQLSRSGIQSQTYALTVEPEDFPLDGTGKWSVELVRVVDGNGCERSLQDIGEDGQATRLLGGASRAARLDVEIVEAANISPVGTRLDYCVGETIDFVLQGSPPWTVEYTFEGRTSRAPVKTTTFSRIAEQPGVLRVESIAHQHNRCQTRVGGKVGMTKTIHALPTVHVREGHHFVEDLREGNQAEIVFNLQGDPPFSFTFQRTQAVDRFAKPAVLETHTVTGIEQDVYTITTAEEGTWSVIWLQDKWCAVSADMPAGRGQAAVPQGSGGDGRKLIKPAGARQR